jgi:hypothetical protein
MRESSIRRPVMHDYQTYKQAHECSDGAQAQHITPTVMVPNKHVNTTDTGRNALHTTDSGPVWFEHSPKRYSYSLRLERER